MRRLGGFQAKFSPIWLKALREMLSEIRTLRVSISVSAWLLASVGPSCAQDGKSTRDWVELAAKAEPTAALLHLRNGLLAWPDLREGPVEKRKLGERWVRLLVDKARSPKDIAVVMEGVAPVKVQRQLLFQRYLEQRMYQQPAPFWVSLEFATDEEPVLRRIFPAER